LLIEIIGEPGVGKTHLASQAPLPFLIDTTPKGEAKSTFLKVVKDVGRYTHIRNWDELRSAIEYAGKRDDVKTIIIDTSADLQDLAREEYLKRTSKSSGKERISALQIEYGKIRDIVDAEVIFRVTGSPPVGLGRNLVCTSQMKNLYKNIQDADGRVHTIKEGRQRDGYDRLDFESDIRLYVSLTTDSRPKRTVSVIKNRFIDRASDDWVPEISPSWEGIKSTIKLAEGERLLE
jgi:hypothetical protein